MWVFAGGMQRAGSTLQYQMAGGIVEHCGLGRRVTWHDPGDHERVLADDGGDELLVFKSHELTPAIRRAVDAGRGRCLYIYRDLRDVISSMMDKFGCRFTPEQAATTARSLMAAHAAWTSIPDTHVARYEDVINDMATEINSLARYLGAAVDAPFAARLAADLAPARQAERIRQAAQSDTMVRVSESIAYHPDTLLHENHLLDGRPGRYRDRLSSELVEAVEGQAAQWLREHGYAV
ncbi:sulfotransferase family protein [Pseudodesulfovibrio portus]|uniref:Sulfotransferase domain-containing protein n=1 Tax=Pseudodesulfovibrio portus TaxID=231439 RepID=A0ABN6RY43_9BACT|nr:sulfotransferase domain-containing protein [Pseudodesulfovibrio portus]BDQ34341.1 hypothetical protein JCM14722_18830 [Pseudodesulfovibrio portus]